MLAVVAAIVLVAGAAITVNALSPGAEIPPLSLRAGVGHIDLEGPGRVDSDPSTHVAVRVYAGASPREVVAQGSLDEFGGLVLDSDTRSNPPSPLAAGFYQVEVDVAANPNPVPLGTVEVLDATASPGSGWPYAAQDLIAQSNPVTVGGTLREDRRYGYLTVRDGTQLAFYLQLPPACTDSGALVACSVPTVVDYSAYEPSSPGRHPDPDKPLVSRDADRFDDEYAVVGVNSRGTGCSGGAMRPLPWSTVEGLDGYDAIETIGAQPWSTGRVGMVGHSYPGQSQLNVARFNPPSLKAITPAAVVDDLYSVHHPGGMENAFASQTWAGAQLNSHLPGADPQTRLDLAEDLGARVSDLGEVATTLIKDESNARLAHRRAYVEGDAVCLANLRLHGQISPVGATFEAASLKTSSGPLHDLSARQYVQDIAVPTLLVGSFHDTYVADGGLRLFDELAASVESMDGPFRRMVVGNGHHNAVTDNQALKAEVHAFVDLFVKGGDQSADSTPGDMPGPCESIDYDGSTEAEVLASLTAAKPVRVLGELRNVAEGVPTGDYGSCDFRWEVSLDDWPTTGPVASVDTTPPTGNPNSPDYLDLHLAPGGVLRPPDGNPVVPASTMASYVNTPELDPLDQMGDDHTDPQRTPLPGEGIAFDTPPLPATMAGAFIGPASADLRLTVEAPTGWSGSDLPDIGLEVSLWEVNSEDQQVYISSGWLLASQRALDGPASVQWAPVHTFSAPPVLPPGSPGSPTAFDVRVAIQPSAHLLRPGSRLRMTISAPGFATPKWHLDAPDDPATVSVDTAHSQLVLSSLALTDSQLTPGPGLTASNLAASPTSLDPTPSPSAPPTRDTSSLLGQPWAPVPSAPDGVAVAQLDNDSLSVTWDPPASGTGISGYRITDIMSGTEETVSAASTSTTLDSLPTGPTAIIVQPLHPLLFAPTTMQGPVTSAPGSISVASTGSTQAVLNFAEPHHNLGPGLTKYLVTVESPSGSYEVDASDLSITTSGSTVTATISGLDPSTQYDIDIRATNHWGQSEAASTTATTQP